MSAPLSPFWSLVATWQSQSNTTMVNNRMWATEDALETVLRTVTPDGLVTGNEWTMQAMMILQGNRSAKHRHRQDCLAAHQRANASQHVSLDTAPELASHREQLAQLHRLTTPEEWALLEALADGETYDDIAHATGVSVGSLKTKICRLRQRLIAQPRKELM
jgi:DNA-binding NarL/FixJ family response regulator